MNPRDFAEVATLLTRLGGEYEEGRARSAASRLYYSAFLETRIRLENECKIRFRKREAHQEIRNSLERTGVKELRFLASLIKSLKDLREDSDYDPDGENWSDDATEAARLYQEFAAKFPKADVSMCKDESGRV